MDPDLMDLFLLEACLQARFVIEAADLLKRAEARKPSAAAATRKWFAIQALMASAANVYKMLWTGAQHKTVRKSERKPLREALGLSEASCLRKTAIRTAFEHFDQRLAEWHRTAPHPKNYPGRLDSVQNRVSGIGLVASH